MPLWTESAVQSVKKSKAVLGVAEPVTGRLFNDADPPSDLTCHSCNKNVDVSPNTLLSTDSSSLLSILQQINSSTSMSLELLPTELKLQILHQLPARSLACLEKVNKHFHAFISSNEVRLARSIEGKEGTRLQDHLYCLMYYDPSLSLLDALIRHFTYYGIPSHSVPRDEIMLDFVNLRVCRFGYGPLSDERSADGFVAEALMSLHIDHHFVRPLQDQYQSPHYTSFSLWEEEMSLRNFRAQYSRQEQQRLWSQITSADCFPEADRYLEVKDFKTLPHHFLTKKSWYPEGFRRMIERHRETSRQYCDVVDLVRMFEVPKLPGRRLQFAYCTTRSEMKEVVLEATQAGASTLRPLLRAHVLEDMLIW